MSASATIDRPDVEAYLAAVRDELADLGAEERDDLLADVEASILESAEESDAPIAARLGPPAEFAAELRAAAGLGSSPAARTWRRPSFEELRRDPRVAAASRIARELAPIWWVARAYVVVAVVAWLADADRSTSPPDTFRLGGPEVGLVLLALALTASLGLGLWQRRHDGRSAAPILAVNLVLAVLAVPVYDDLLDWLKNPPAAVVVVDEPVVPLGLAHDGVPIQNVYPYGRDGRLLLDVLLFDQNGAPLNVRPGDAGDSRRRVLRTRVGVDLFNSFPIRYYDAGTRQVGRPYAGPAVAWRPIATPPLPAREEPARKR